MLLVNAIMTSNPVTIHEGVTVREAARLLETLAVRHLPVVNDDGELVGMVSDRDLRGSPGGTSANDLLASAPPASAPVVDVMSSDALRAGPDDDVVSVAAQMVDNHVGAIPVVDGHDQLVGIVSYVDILRALIASQEPIDAPRRGTNHAGRPIPARPAAAKKRSAPAPRKRR